MARSPRTTPTDMTQPMTAPATPPAAGSAPVEEAVPATAPAAPETAPQTDAPASETKDQPTQVDPEREAKIQAVFEQIKAKATPEQIKSYPPGVAEKMMREHAALIVDGKAPPLDDDPPAPPAIVGREVVLPGFRPLRFPATDIADDAAAVEAFNQATGITKTKHQHAVKPITDPALVTPEALSAFNRPGYAG